VHRHRLAKDLCREIANREAILGCPRFAPVLMSANLGASAANLVESHAALTISLGGTSPNSDRAAIHLGNKCYDFWCGYPLPLLLDFS
jgi:hypothetical protein